MPEIDIEFKILLVQICKATAFRKVKLHQHVCQQLSVLLVFFIYLIGAVLAVAQHRKFFMRKMRAYLVRAPGYKLYFQQGQLAFGF